jgi:hypothetical protein
MTFIRHSIHHPENTHNNKYSNEELKKSTQQMLEIITAIKLKNKADYALESSK